LHNRPIGVLDSGIGGLTVVRELLRLLPNERIQFYSDSANCPYGNRTQSEILGLIEHAFRFLEARNVKVITLACNTISAALDTSDKLTDIPLISIIEPAARRVAADRLKAVGVIATEFTVASRSYERQIARFAPETAVFSKGSPLLAALIDSGADDIAAIDAEIRRQLPFVLSNGAVHEVVLGCTHYPIVLDRFQACYPDVVFIDPAHEEALATQNALAAAGALADRPQGCLTIFTSGDPAGCRRACDKLGISALTDVSIEQIR